mmetsp:Transcript_15324/g.34815  ORF Transcript_15324/g.34815 Transcript_15324/m.34815 type:complete len:293 (-) Transcript_15324:182-1060(-)
MHTPDGLTREAVDRVEGSPARGSVVGLVPEVVLEGHDALITKLLDLHWLLLPALDPFVRDEAQRPAGDHQRADGVVARRLQHLVLVRLGGRRFLGADEPRAHPNTVSTKGQRCGEAAPVEDAPGSNGANRVAEGAHLALAAVHNLRDEGHGADIAGVATALAALSDDDVCPGLQCLHRVPYGADHVGNHNPASVKLVNSPLWRHSHSADEELCLFSHDDVNELRQVSVGVVVVCLPCASSNLWQCQVHAEGQVWGRQTLLDPGYLLLHDLGGHAETANGANASRVGHSSSQV